jgi:hypothetical protein
VLWALEITQPQAFLLQHGSVCASERIEISNILECDALAGNKNCSWMPQFACCASKIGFYRGCLPRLRCWGTLFSIRMCPRELNLMLLYFFIATTENIFASRILYINEFFPVGLFCQHLYASQPDFNSNLAQLLLGGVAFFLVNKKLENKNDFNSHRRLSDIQPPYCTKLFNVSTLAIKLF